MKWERAIAIILTIGALFTVWIVPARAESTVQPSHSYAFGRSATFIVPLTSDTLPTQATLFLDVNGKELASYEGTIDQREIKHQRDLRTHPLPPFAEITYWWQLEGPEADQRQTEPITFRYVDNRYVWQNLHRGNLTVHWISGATKTMASALDVGTRALADIDYALKPPKSGDLHIYIYPTHGELQSAMQLVGHTWAGGIAYPELNVVLIAIPATDEAVVRMKRTIPHELAHQMLYNRLGTQGYQNLPVWLNEGLATNFEQSPNATYALVLEESEDLISLEALCAPFPDHEGKARLAYAQSQSVVSYLRQAYGWSTIRQLLDVYADGVGCETGVVKVLGTNLEQMEHQWTQWRLGENVASETDATGQRNMWIRTQNWAELTAETAGPWLVFAGFLLIPGALTTVFSKRRR
jgi:hypothetical protein